MPAPLLMGILNVTPDSFSDGGQHLGLEAAHRAAFEMIEAGADLIDVGGESTRPGALPVSLDVELGRVVPVVERLAKEGIRVSVDTRKAAVAEAALIAGAAIVNDITALSDSAMREVCARHGATVCLMHMQGEPLTMQENPVYEDVVVEVRDYLAAAAQQAEGAGIAREKIWIDPGIGFGKTIAHNLALLRHLSILVETGYPVLVGVSRKGFLGRLGGTPASPLSVGDRLPATLAAQVLAQAAGAGVIRAHDVREAKQAMRVADAIIGGS